MEMARCFASAALGVLLTLALALPAEAANAVDPGSKTPAYKRWSYPAQIPNGPIETGNLPGPSQSGGFLTLPFLDEQFVTSIFDHCSPNYVPDGLVCRFDGAVGGPGSGTDPKFSGGHSITPGGKDYVYYDGHDGPRADRHRDVGHADGRSRRAGLRPPRMGAGAGAGTYPASSRRACAGAGTYPTSSRRAG